MKIVASQNHTMKHATGPIHNGINITNNDIVGNRVSLRMVNKANPSNEVPRLGPMKTILFLLFKLIKNKLLS